DENFSQNKAKFHRILVRCRSASHGWHSSSLRLFILQGHGHCSPSIFALWPSGNALVSITILFGSQFSGGFGFVSRYLSAGRFPSSLHLLPRITIRVPVSFYGRCVSDFSLAFLCRVFSRGDAKASNHAMERTATRRAFAFY